MLDERGSFEDSSSSPDEDYDYETTSEELELDSIRESPADLIFQQEPFVHFRSLNNYLNNLNLAALNLHLNNRFNAFVQESSLYKLYENSPPFPGVRVPPLPKPPKIEVIVSNLWKQLGDNDELDEAKNLGKRLELEKARKRACEEAQRKLGPKIQKKQQQISRESIFTNSIIQEEGHETSRRGLKHQNPNLSFLNKGVEPTGVTIASPEVEDPQLNLNQEFWSQFLGFKTDAEENSGVVGEEPALAPTPPVNPFYSRFYLTSYDIVKVRNTKLIIL